MLDVVLSIEENRNLVKTISLIHRLEGLITWLHMVYNKANWEG